MLTQSMDFPPGNVLNSAATALHCERPADTIRYPSLLHEIGDKPCTLVGAQATNASKTVTGNILSETKPTMMLDSRSAWQARGKWRGGEGQDRGKM